MAVDVTAAQVERFRKILVKFPPQGGLPGPDAWREMSDDDVWVRVMSQVVVVGRADPAKRLYEKAIRDRIAWEKVSRLEQPAAAQAIWSVLRDIGARYAGQDSKLCRKTGAMVKNLVFFKKYAGGPKGFIRDVATLKGGSQDKIAFVSKRLSYIKNKGARDFLTTGFGMVKDHIAFDSRVIGVLRHVGVSLPSGVTVDPVVYARAEQDLIRQVCVPLNLSGAEFDQMLFLNHKDIQRMVF